MKSDCKSAVSTRDDLSHRSVHLLVRQRPWHSRIAMSKNHSGGQVTDELVVVDSNAGLKFGRRSFIVCRLRTSDALGRCLGAINTVESN